MPMALDSYEKYTQLIFSLLADRPSVEQHTVSVYTTSRTTGIVRGQVVFHSEYVLRIFEQVDFLSRRILKYFYEVTYRGEQIWWYDPMPHPHDPELQSTHPHHKHVKPNIKRHRIPEARLSFVKPNLPWLVDEVEGQ